MQSSINCMDTQLASTKDGAVVLDARIVLSTARISLGLRAA
jgi:hypothetical protein